MYSPRSGFSQQSLPPQFPSSSPGMYLQGNATSGFYTPRNMSPKMFSPRNTQQGVYTPRQASRAMYSPRNTSTPYSYSPRNTSAPYSYSPRNTSLEGFTPNNASPNMYSPRNSSHRLGSPGASPLHQQVFRKSFDKSRNSSEYSTARSSFSSNDGCSPRGKPHYNRRNQQGRQSDKEYNIMDYIHPSMMEDPWADLMVQYEKKMSLKAQS